MCAAAKPCPTVSEVHGETNQPPTDASLRCLVQAFHDRTPGIYQHDSGISGFNGTSTTTEIYLIKPDGTVNRVQKGGAVISSPQICALRPPADYDACLASVSTDGYATSECGSVYQWVTGCAAGDVACD
jgi:hypothetical protein